MLIAVFTDPKLFPSKFSKLERDALIKASFRDGTYHHIVVVAVNQDESGCPVVTKFKNLKDYNYWCKNRGL
jgi:hypothetical protein